MASHSQRARVWILSLGLLAACGGGKVTGPGAPATSNSVTVGNNFFQPATTSVGVGTTVKWTWAGGVAHNVTFDDGVASPTQPSGTYTRTFTTAGTYRYHCTIHGTMMSGTIIVTQPTSTY